MVYCCCICGNEESSKNSHLTFHRLPKDENVRNEWLKRIKNKNVRRAKVCSIHFRREDYRALCERRLLKKESIPRLFIREVIPDQLSLAESETPCIESVNNDIADQEAAEGIMKTGKETDENIETLSDTDTTSEEECTTSSQDKTGSKRPNDSCDRSRAQNKKFCSLKEYGVFRKGNFLDEDSWDRFLRVVEGFRKRELQMERQNKLLLTRIQNLRDIVEQLKEKNLLSDSLAKVLTACFK